MAEAPLHDVFISHAFEDKQSIADELAMELTKTGMKVWYSGFELQLGDSIAGSINKGLKAAAFGIVIISPTYLQKRWAMNELTTFFAQETEKNKILPILHGITVNELREQFPLLADRYMISSERGMDEIIKKVLQAMSGLRNTEGYPANKSQSIKKATHKENDKQHPAENHNTNNSNVKVMVLIILIIAAIAIYFMSQDSDSPNQPVNKEHSSPSNSN